MKMHKLDYEKFRQLRNTFNGYLYEIGFKLTKVDHLYAKAEIVLTDNLQNPIGSVHGGIIFSLADTVGIACANSVGVACTTLSGNINYLSAARDCTKLIGEAIPIKIGSRIAVVQVVITDEEGNKIANTIMTYQYLPDMEFPFKEAFIKDK